jgi:exopolyphosphatase/guanosine-5'-triphosphate,3'-diphosphate pyrophosphatase
VDVGGGSTELILGQGDHARVLASVPLGAIIVQRRWLGADPVSRAASRRARQHLMSLFRRRADQMRRAGYSHLIATGGSIQRIARICRAVAGAPTDDVHRVRLSRADIDMVVACLSRARTRAERLTIPGLDPDRVDSLLGGALIFQAIGRLLETDGWLVSMSALRSGLLVDTHRALVRGRPTLSG